MDNKNGQLKTTEYANSVFEQPWWLDIVAPGCWGECFVKEGEKVIARMPYVFEGGKIRNPKYTQTLGIWMDESVRAWERGNRHLWKQKEIINQLLQDLPKNKGVSLVLDHSNEYILPFCWKGYRIEPTFSYRFENLADHESIQQSYGKTVMKNIRAAQKNVYIDDSCDDGEVLLELVDMTYERQGRKNPINSELTKRVISSACENGHGKILIAKDEKGRAHSGAFFLYDEKTCYYLLGGQDPEFKSDGSQNLILYEGINFAAKVSKHFDFEGSMIEGIENFFRQFGAKQVINYRVTKQGMWADIKDAMKPRIKKAIGYKI